MTSSSECMKILTSIEKIEEPEGTHDAGPKGRTLHPLSSDISLQRRAGIIEKWSQGVQQGYIPIVCRCQENILQDNKCHLSSMVWPESCLNCIQAICILQECLQVVVNHPLSQHAQQTYSY